MVLIGDPKPSIYAYRGGDAQTYLVGAGTAGQTRATAGATCIASLARASSLVGCRG